jgi:DNA-binding IclR family transcriptional regulator
MHAMTGSAGQPPPKYPLGSVDNLLRLLSMFRTKDSIGVTEAAESLGIALSTAHRLLAMLEFHEYVVKDASLHDYAPGPELMELGLAVATGAELRARARPFLESLAVQTNETASLAILVGNQAAFIESVESLRALRITSIAGSVFPAHTTSAGKVLLAALDRGRLMQLYDSEVLTGGTSRAIRSRRQLIKELGVIRKQGYAVNQGESDDLRGTVAVLVVDRQERVRAALSVSMPLARFNETPLEGLIATTLDTARQIRESL